ncbi:hypothetical protein INT45_003301, partial [Circinella minor]
RDDVQGTKEINKEFVYSPEEKKLLHKINWTTTPFICIVSFFQIPNQFLLQKVPIGKYLGVYVILWGISLASMAWGNNFAQLATSRFFLGFFEATTYPCLQLLISTIYRRREQGTVFSIMLISSCVAGLFAGPIALGFKSMNGTLNWSGWRWCMAITGAITSCFGIIIYFLMPDNPKSKWYRLTSSEMDIVEDRIRDNAVVISKKYQFDHIYEALQECRYYCYIGVCFLISVISGFITLYSTILISKMGIRKEISMLLHIPVAGAEIPFLFIVLYLSRRFGENNCIGALTSGMIFIGLVLLIVLGNQPAAISGLLLINVAPTFMMVLTLLSNNVSGYTKKVFYNGSYAVAFCLGNFAGPLFINESDNSKNSGENQSGG